MNQYVFFWHFPKCNGVPSLPGLIPVSDNDRAWYDDSWKVMWMTAPVMSTPSTTSTTTRSTQGFEASWTKTSFDTSNTTPIKSAFSLMRQGSQQTSVPRQGIHAHWQNSLLRRKVLRNEQIGVRYDCYTTCTSHSTLSGPYDLVLNPSDFSLDFWFSCTRSVAKCLVYSFVSRNAIPGQIFWHEDIQMARNCWPKICLA